MSPHLVIPGRRRVIPGPLFVIPGLDPGTHPNAGVCGGPRVKPGDDEATVAVPWRSSAGPPHARSSVFPRASDSQISTGINSENTIMLRYSLAQKPENDSSRPTTSAPAAASG